MAVTLCPRWASQGWRAAWGTRGRLATRLGGELPRRGSSTIIKATNCDSSSPRPQRSMEACLLSSAKGGDLGAGGSLQGLAAGHGWVQRL